MSCVNGLTRNPHSLGVRYTLWVTIIILGFHCFRVCLLYISYSDFRHILHCFKFIITNKYSHLWLWLLYFCNLSSLRMVILFASKSPPPKLEAESDIAIQMFLLSWNMCITVWYELFKFSYNFLLGVDCYVNLNCCVLNFNISCYKKESHCINYEMSSYPWVPLMC